MAADWREEVRRLNELVAKWRRWADAMSHVRQANRVRECADDLERELRQLAERAEGDPKQATACPYIRHCECLGQCKHGFAYITPGDTKP